MKYELIPKEVLDEVCMNIQNANNSFALAHAHDQKNKPLLDNIYLAKLQLGRAYQAIQHNRTQCNVRPEGD
jgi:hypothetical protein